METKKCTICKEEKKLCEFNKNKARKDGLNNICRSCNSIKLKEHYSKNKAYYAEKRKKWQDDRREWFDEFKQTLKCEVCGENRYWVLDFHHNNPHEKDFDVSNMILNLSKEKIMAEIEKCKILCSNCHRDFHYHNTPISSNG